MAEINGIDLLRVKQRSVHKLFARNKIKTLKNLADLQSFCYDPNNGRTFYKHVKSFRISAPLENVWRTYKTIPPQDTWRGRMVSFGMMYSRQENHITFSNDAYAGLAPGQLIFLNLNLFANKAHLAVGHEVVDVLEDKKHIKICYVQNGASIGTQLIQLNKVTETETEVIHETWYTSGSWLRDKILYPMFHARAITEFHTNVKHAAEQL